MAPSLAGNATESAAADGQRRGISGDKEQLWSRLGEAANLEELIDLVRASGFHPVLVSRSDLLRAGVSEKEADFGAILGALGAFGAILDSGRTSAKLDDADIQRELAARELSLVSQLGLAKRSVNRLISSLHVAKNLGRAVCLVIDDGVPADAIVSVESVMAPLWESRRLLAHGCQLPAVIIGAPAAGDAVEGSSGGGGGGTVTRVDEDMEAAECDFASMMLVAYETAPAGVAAVSYNRGSA